jgi:hypothetical protein
MITPVSIGTQIPQTSKRMNDFVGMIRLYMRDFPELNRLIKGEETSDRMIAWAVMDALDDWNSTPPFLGNATIDGFPSLSLLREGTVIRLLESVGLLQTRNQLSFSDGGITVNHSDKTPLIMNWLQYFKSSYEDKKVKMKSSINIEMGMLGTGNFSEYWIISGTYLYL